MVCAICGQRYRRKNAAAKPVSNRMTSPVTAVTNRRKAVRGVMKKQTPVIQLQQEKPISTPNRALTSIGEATLAGLTECADTTIPMGTPPLVIKDVTDEGGGENA